ncbi:hypothetical protein P8935_15415 [Telmatobacter sp. DSM 110680]|uniref:Uncharacterized protein n=1 Tax=Telmatobacter sp. DSM 110680 TaxID=3036704 RepID=A0AAU7DF35_9BACT
MPSPWSNLRGPAKLLANSATVLLVASGFLGVEAGIMIVLGEARNVVIKPFVLLGYLEICAMFFSSVGIICGIVGLIFYRPYIYISEKIYLYRARHTALVTDQHTHFEDVARVHVPNPEEDGAPD